MKRILLFFILLFPVATLLFWVIHGGAIRPHKTPDENTSMTSPTNLSSNAPAQTNKPDSTNPPAK